MILDNDKLAQRNTRTSRDQDLREAVEHGKLIKLKELGGLTHTEVKQMRPVNVEVKRRSS